MNDQQHLTDESFDDLARSAGAALRRPAPSDGVQAVRTARRRQQQTRAALGGAALVAVIAVGAAMILRDDPETTVVVQPDETTPTTVAPTVPNSTVPNTAVTTLPPVTVPVTAPLVTTPPVTAPPATTPVEPVVGLSADAIAWRDARIAEGFTIIDVVPGDGTTARMLTAQRPDPQAFANAVLLDDGRVVETPPDIAGTFDPELHAAGGFPAAVSIVADTISVWQLDPATEEWKSSGDLGLGPIDTETAFTVLPVTVSTVGDVLLVAVEEYQDTGGGALVPSDARRGVIVGGDLSTTPMAASPDGVPMDWSIVAGGKALQIFGQNLGSLGGPTHLQPWAYDPLGNSWTEIPLPDWFDCTSDDPFACSWLTSFDGGDTMQFATSRGVLVGVPDGSMGLYDPTANSWTRVDTPFQVFAWWSAVDLGDRVLLAPGRLSDGSSDTIGVIDLTTGTWTAGDVAVPADIQQRVDTEWFDMRWHLRSTGTRVMAVPGPANAPSDEAPIAVYDVATGLWSTPNEVDLANWDALATSFTA